MGQPLRQYDSKKNQFSFGGQVASGFAPDSMFEVEYDEDSFDLEVGTDGEQCRSTVNNDAATVTIKLMASSAFNDVLSGFWLADKANPGAGIQPLFIKDGSGRSLHTGVQAWVQKPPPAAYDKKRGTREWKIRVGSLTSNYGGN